VLGHICTLNFFINHLLLFKQFFLQLFLFMRLNFFEHILSHRRIDYILDGEHNSLIPIGIKSAVVLNVVLYLLLLSRHLRYFSKSLIGSHPWK